MVNDDNFVILLDVLNRTGCLAQNLENLNKMCLDERWRKTILQVFERISESRGTMRFFSMKNCYEIWLHYVPYLKHEDSKLFKVPMWGNCQTWPGADRENISAFAAFLKLIGSDVFVSIEMSAQDVNRVRLLAKTLGCDESGNTGNIIRLKTKKFPFRDERDLPQAVNKAMDEFCRVGEKLVAALDQLG